MIYSLPINIMDWLYLCSLLKYNLIDILISISRLKKSLPFAKPTSIISMIILSTAVLKGTQTSNGGFYLDVLSSIFMFLPLMINKIFNK